MASKNFEINDLVWAKMKGFPHWPGKITVPPADTKPKKNHHYIFFFGSENFAWIADDFIELHSESMVEKYGNRKGEFFRKAVEAIKNYSKGIKKIHTPTGNSETRDENVSKGKESEGKLDKIANGEAVPRKKSPQGTRVAQKFKSKSLVKKVTPVTTSSIKKNSRKRTHSPDTNQNTSKGGKSASFSPDDIFVSGPTAANNDVSTLNSEIVDKTKIIPTEKKLGFIGLVSKIGQGIVKNLQRTGHSIIVWSESDECKMFAEQLKIKTAPTPADVVEEADVIFCYVSDSDNIKELVEGDCGVLKGMERCREREKGFVGMSPSMDPKISHDIVLKGGRYLEAPVCGSRIEANEGTLFILTAGDNVLYRDCKSCFDSISKKHFFVSAEVGAASKMNIVHNMLTGTIYASLAESLSLVNKVGLKSKDFLDILQVGALNSNSVLHTLTSMIEKNYVNGETDFTVNQMQQDFNLGLSLGHDIAQHTELFAHANELFKRCKSKNFGDHDVSAVYEGTKP